MSASRLSFPGLVVVICALTACAPLTIFYKQGEEVSRMEHDLTDCRVSALNRVPVDRRQHYVPPIYDTRTICDGSGNCRSVHVLVSPGRWKTYDANEELRDDVVDQCMAEQGYAKVSLPRCDASTTRATEPVATHVLPPLTENSCVVPLQSGRWKIVTPST